MTQTWSCTGSHAAPAGGFVHAAWTWTWTWHVGSTIQRARTRRGVCRYDFSFMYTRGHAARSGRGGARGQLAIYRSAWGMSRRACRSGRVATMPWRYNSQVKVYI